MSVESWVDLGKGDGVFPDNDPEAEARETYLMSRMQELEDLTAEIQSLQMEKEARSSS